MERKDAATPAMPHHLTLHERRLLDLEGVSDVGHFDEMTVVVTTALGELTICGEDLHVRRLNLEEGALSIEGQVNSLSYAERGRRGGLFGRILR